MGLGDIKQPETTFCCIKLVFKQKSETIVLTNIFTSTVQYSELAK